MQTASRAHVAPSRTLLVLVLLAQSLLTTIPREPISYENPYPALVFVATTLPVPYVVEFLWDERAQAQPVRNTVHLDSCRVEAGNGLSRRIFFYSDYVICIFNDSLCSLFVVRAIITGNYCHEFACIQVYINAVAIN
eukprot:scaffold3461_cov18-Prasinocladus_malaysianus.AAC.1